MGSIYNFQQDISRLVRNGNYTDALAAFKTGKVDFESHQISSNVYLVCDILKSLRMTNAHSAALKFISVYGIEINGNMNQGIVIALSLVLYDWYKKIIEISDSDISQTTFVMDYIITLMPILRRNETDFAYDFYNNIVLKVIRTESKRSSINWSLIIDFCESIDCNHLQTECHEIKVVREGKEKITEMASAKEEWLSVYSKSLFATERYQDCIDVCVNALSSIKKMHYSNDIWFKRRMAQCYINLDSLEKSLSLYKDIIKRKSDWFILSELGSIYFNTKYYNEAYEFMCKAMLEYGPLDYKIDLIENLGSVSLALNNKEIAKKHYMLAFIIRKLNGWKISDSLKSQLDYNFEDENLNKLKSELIIGLRNEWRTITNKIYILKNNDLTGVITNMSLPKDAGVDVWIKDEKGTQYYSFVKRNDTVFNKLAKDVRVSFKVKPLPNKPMDKAIGLKLI